MTGQHPRDGGVGPPQLVAHQAVQPVQGEEQRHDQAEVDAGPGAGELDQGLEVIEQRSIAEAGELDAGQLRRARGHAGPIATVPVVEPPLGSAFGERLAGGRGAPAELGHDAGRQSHDEGGRRLARGVGRAERGPDPPVDLAPGEMLLETPDEQPHLVEHGGDLFRAGVQQRPPERRHRLGVVGGVLLPVVALGHPRSSGHDRDGPGLEKVQLAAGPRPLDVLGYAMARLDLEGRARHRVSDLRR
ncbi:MAG: hypothetical protein M5T61_15195 [Acidimicrobiia bacterium]|nr:hypothetical protein [Acidimicrobiia bacterium]